MVSEIFTQKPILTAKDERDITRDVKSIMVKLASKELGPAAYDGEELSEESAALFRDELEIALRRLKLINKEKYNPYKNKAKVQKREEALVPLAAHANLNATAEDQEADIALIKRRKAIIDAGEE